MGEKLASVEPSKSVQHAYFQPRMQVNHGKAEQACTYRVARSSHESYAIANRFIRLKAVVQYCDVASQIGGRCLVLTGLQPTLT